VFIDAEDEDPNTSMAIASITIFEGPIPTHKEALSFLGSRLTLVPRYRQKLRAVPLRLGRPVWVDDPNFDLTYHVRRVGLPKPGRDKQLADLVGWVMSQRLDRDHPLWEYWFVEGLSRGRWALIAKVHHCMVDGIAGTDMYRLILDIETEPPAPPPAAGDGATEDELSAVSLLAEAGTDMARLVVRDALAISAAVTSPRQTIRQAAALGRAAARLYPSLWPAVSSSLSGQIGRQRRYTWARASLEDIKTIKREFGGTVNDVVLAVIASGFRALLLKRGEEPEAHEVPSLVPVSVRAPGDEGVCGNQVSAAIANLPVHVADPVERLAAVRAELGSLKESRESLIGEGLTVLGQFSPYPLASRWVRAAFSLPQREIVTVTTNVPGPRQPLFLAGRKLQEIIPYVPIASRVRTGISILSYCDNMAFGITGDFAANPDLDVLARGIEHGVSELLTAAAEHAREEHAPAD
jgi:diacylglycerol O-acyltransferase